MPDEKSKYYGRYPADKAERAKYDQGQNYKGADGKTYPGKTKGRREAGTQPPPKIKQPDEQLGIDEKVERRRKEKKERISTRRGLRRTKKYKQYEVKQSGLKAQLPALGHTRQKLLEWNTKKMGGRLFTGPGDEPGGGGIGVDYLEDNQLNQYVRWLKRKR